MGIGNVNQREARVTQVAPGRMFVVFWVPCPYAYKCEQTLSRLLAPLKCRYYSGNGASEHYWFLAAPVVFAFQLLVVLFWLYGLAGVVLFACSL